ncbi:hypothetical protein CHS0354_010090 [Potamilus streckersoni]|uniref:Uncharacterized protein n=1 Tax=Potamilus streckersoni TaxID=2493646 RepID=A0AAE0RRC7_9BIVA|nr:hypothetical protein CHS0354_010090 [Potamilus streckersoni]
MNAKEGNNFGEHRWKNNDYHVSVTHAILLSVVLPIEESMSITREKIVLHPSSSNNTDSHSSEWGYVE